MSSFKLFAVLFASVFVLSASGVSAAQGKGKNDAGCCPDGKYDKFEKRGKKDFDRMAKELNLTEAQKKQLDEHKAKHKTQMKDMMTQTMEKNEALRQELQKTDTDKAKVESLKSDLKGLHSKRIDSMTDSVSEMKQILTPEQFQKMNDNMQKRHEKMKKSMKKMHKKGNPGGGMGMGGPPPDGDMN